MTSIGQLRERLTIQTATPRALAVSSITRTSTTATVTTREAHGYTTGDYVTIAGASEAGYNLLAQVTVTSTTTFTYTVSGSLASSAAGQLTATYTSDLQGGQAKTWRPVATVWAQLLPQRVSERLEAQAARSQVDLRFLVRRRNDITPAMQAVWTPNVPRDSDPLTLEIFGVLPEGDGRTYMQLECGVSA